MKEKQAELRIVVVAVVEVAIVPSPTPSQCLLPLTKRMGSSQRRRMSESARGPRHEQRRYNQEHTWALGSECNVTPEPPGDPCKSAVRH